MRRQCQEFLCVFVSSSSFFSRCISKSENLSLRVSAIEERLGIFHISVYGVKVDDIIPVFVKCYADILGWSVSALHLLVVHRLDPRRSGVLLSVSPLTLKQQILSKADDFQRQGLLVGISLVCVYVDFISLAFIFSTWTSRPYQREIGEFAAIRCLLGFAWDKYYVLFCLLCSRIY